KGSNTITAVAKDTHGKTATDSVTVTATTGSGGGGGGGGGGPVPPLPPPPPEPPKNLVGCRIPPRLHGQPLKVAKRYILKWHCRPGKVLLAYSKTVYKGRVISTRPHAGTHLKAGTHVTIVVSKGKKPAPRPKRIAHARGGEALRVF